VTGARNSESVIISMLVEPRGKIHASTGILPVKAIDIPPDQYLDALQKLQLSFLTSPIITPKGTLSMPLPSTDGGSWSWIENDGNAWLASQQIEPVVVDGVMNFASQNILEGWLNLSSRVLTVANFKLENKLTDTAVLFISDDPTKNIFTFKFINSTGMPLKLKGGEPVYGGVYNGGSSFAFNFGDILPDTILAHIEITGKDWHSRYFEKTENEPAAWSLSPMKDMLLQPGDTVSFQLKNITCPAGSQSGNFTIGYYNLPEISDSISPVLLPVSVQIIPQLMNYTARK